MNIALPTPPFLQACRAAALLAALVTGAAMAAPVYRVIDLGGLTGKGASRAYALNAQGDVVGDAVAKKSVARRPVLFGKRKPLDLITATGGDASEGRATAINGAGHMAGELHMRDVGLKPFVYRQGTMEVVEVPFTYSNFSKVQLSDLGHLLVSGYLNGNAISSVRQPDGTWVNLKRWNGSHDMVGYAINRQGSVVVGYAGRDLDFWQAVVWRNNKPEPVPGTEGNSVSIATAVNDRGDIAGDRDVMWGNQGGDRAFVVRDGVLTDLTGPNLFSGANGMDNLGRVVGSLHTPGATVLRAFLFQDGQAMMLDDLVEPAQQGLWRIETANAINDDGEIAAIGVSTVTGVERALKLVPVTAP